MQRVYGRKGRELTCGGLIGTLWKRNRNGNPCSDVWLSYQKSVEAIVHRRSITHMEGLNIKSFQKLKRFERDAKKADNPMEMGADRRK